MEEDFLVIDAVLPTNPTDHLFVTKAVHVVPGLADRYAYKKEAGSSDTQHSYDTLKV